MSNDRVNPPLARTPPRAPSTTPTVRERPRPHLWVPGRPRPHLWVPGRPRPHLWVRGRPRPHSGVRGRPRPHSPLLQAPSNPPRAPRRHLAALIPFLLAACTPLKVEPFPEPLRAPRDAPADPAPTLTEAPTELRTSRAPGVVLQESLAEGVADRLGEELTGPPIEVSFHDLPLVTFINEVFGEQLGMSFVVAPGLSDGAEPVTLRLTEPLPPRQLFYVARNVLSQYGVSLREENGVVTFARSQDGSDGVPLVTSGGRALPQVPDSHRTIFHFVPLHIADGRAIEDVIEEAFDGQDLTVENDRDRGGMLLKGRRSLIEQALAIIRTLDQPILRSRHAVILEPAFIDAELLVGELRRVLEAQGYGVGTSIVLLTIEHLNKVVAFAADRTTMAHVEEWAATLDAARQDAIEDAWFTYEVRNTQAAALTETLNVMLGGPNRRRQTPMATSGTSRAGAAGLSGAAGTDTGITAFGGIVVDPNRNVLLFRGSGREWADIRAVIEVLDKPIPSVLIEVVLAEVTLSDIENSGFDFLFKAALDRYGFTGGTRGSLGVKASGLYGTFDSGGDTRAVLGVFYEDSRVVIRSRPRVLVKSGGTATIDVGNEIPVVSQVVDSGTQTEGATNFLQQVSYRKTGVQLEITPIVQASGRVDLEISQSLSEARPTAATSLDGNPTILNRHFSTSLTLQDGGALLLGGLISGSRSGGDTGVPGIAQVPVLGRLFRSDSYQEDRTELMVMVIPYVVTDHEDGWELTQRMREQLELHAEMME